MTMVVSLKEKVVQFLTLHPSPRIAFEVFGEEHVLAYFEWLRSPEIQLNTATDPPASVEQVHEIQRNWKSRDDIFSLILKDRKKDRHIGDVSGSILPCDALSEFSLYSEGGILELQVMIGADEYRGFGFAREAIEHLLCCFDTPILVIAKILKTNVASIKLFEDRLHFTFFHEVPIFRERWYYRFLKPHTS